MSGTAQLRASRFLPRISAGNSLTGHHFENPDEYQGARRWHGA
jgi:hypothetical protein